MSTLLFVTLAAAALATRGAASAVDSAQEMASPAINSQGRQLKQGPIQCPMGSFSQTSTKNGTQMVDCGEALQPSPVNFNSICLASNEAIPRYIT